VYVRAHAHLSSNRLEEIAVSNRKFDFVIDGFVSDGNVDSVPANRFFRPRKLKSTETDLSIFSEVSEEFLSPEDYSYIESEKFACYGYKNKLCK